MRLWVSLSLKVSHSYYSLLQDSFISSNHTISNRQVNFIFMGNVSSPIITRLGIKQFWYKHWYTDAGKTYSKNLRVDTAIEKLLTIYFSYGLLYARSPLIHEYWSTNQFKSIRRDYADRCEHWYRRYFYKNSRLNVEHGYVGRIRSGEYFPLKLWAMRYNGWLILIVSWFKPAKTRSKKLFKLDSNRVMLTTSAIVGLSKTKSFNRLKVLLYFFMQAVQTKSYIYRF